MSNALTPEEWGADCESAMSHAAEHVEWSLPPTFTDRKGDAVHALAALALHGQPFGFTWDDVDALRYYADQNIEDAGPFGEGWTSDETAKAQSTCRSLADRIAALLPPR